MATKKLSQQEKAAAWAAKHAHEGLDLSALQALTEGLLRLDRDIQALAEQLGQKLSDRKSLVKRLKAELEAQKAIRKDPKRKGTPAPKAAVAPKAAAKKAPAKRAPAKPAVKKPSDATH